MQTRSRLDFAVDIGLLLLSAVCFALTNVLAREAYEHGAGATTINAARTTLALILLALWFAARNEAPWLPRIALPAFLATVVCYAIHNPALLVAFRFIPVSLAVLVLYLFPILVMFMAAALGQERLNPRVLVAAFVAFACLALVLGVGETAPDWRGVALALLCAVALAGNIAGAAQFGRHMKSALAVTFNLSLVGVPVFVALMLAAGGPHLPRTAEGWWWTMGSVVASPVALFAFYIALPRIGAPFSSLFMNGEPIITALIALVLLGETLLPLQWAGALGVVGAIVWIGVQRRGAPARPPARPPAR
jgi:drug/metabolite transporter (DMT)-like permease